MKKLTSLALALLLAVACFLPAMAERVATGTVVVTSDGQVNVREKPTTDAKIVGKVKPGEEYDSYGSDSASGWYEIVLDDGTVGFVSPKMVSYATSEPPFDAAEEAAFFYAEYGADNKWNYHEMLSVLNTMTEAKQAAVYPYLMQEIMDAGEGENYSAYCSMLVLAGLESDKTFDPPLSDILRIGVDHSSKNSANLTGIYAIPLTYGALGSRYHIRESNGVPKYEPDNPQPGKAILVINPKSRVEGQPYEEVGLYAVSGELGRMAREIDALAEGGIEFTSNADEASMVIVYGVSYPSAGEYGSTGRVKAYGCKLTLTAASLTGKGTASFSMSSSPGGTIWVSDDATRYYEPLPEYAGSEKLQQFVDKILAWD